MASRNILILSILEENSFTGLPLLFCIYNETFVLRRFTAVEFDCCLAVSYKSNIMSHQWNLKTILLDQYYINCYVFRIFIIKKVWSSVPPTGLREHFQKIHNR